MDENDPRSESKKPYFLRSHQYSQSHKSPYQSQTPSSHHVRTKIKSKKLLIQRNKEKEAQTKY